MENYLVLREERERESSRKDEIYMARDTVTMLRRKDYKLQLQTNVYATAECSDLRSRVRLECS